MATYALIKNKVVENTIIADADFVELIKADWDEVVEYTDENPAGIGYTRTKTGFKAPVESTTTQVAE